MKSEDTLREHLRELLVLRLNAHEFSAAAAAALTESPLGKRLAVLEMSEMPSDDDIPF